jgi:hypothetical protein
MQSFIHRKNLENFRARLAESKGEAERKQLRKLLAEEEAKEPAVARSESKDADGQPLTPPGAAGVPPRGKT